MENAIITICLSLAVGIFSSLISTFIVMSLVDSEIRIRRVIRSAWKKGIKSMKFAYPEVSIKYSYRKLCKKVKHWGEFRMYIYAFYKGG